MLTNKDYPYLATYCNTVEEADKINEYGLDGWIMWNGTSMTWPTFVKYKGKIYTFEEFRKEIWNF